MKGAVVFHGEIGVGRLRADPVFQRATVEEPRIDPIEVCGECVDGEKLASIQPFVRVRMIGKEAMRPGKQVTVPCIFLLFCVVPAAIRGIDPEESVRFKCEHAMHGFEYVRLQFVRNVVGCHCDVRDPKGRFPVVAPLAIPFERFRFSRPTQVVCADPAEAPVQPVEQDGFFDSGDCRIEERALIEGRVPAKFIAQRSDDHFVDRSARGLKFVHIEGSEVAVFFILIDPVLLDVGNVPTHQVNEVGFRRKSWRVRVAWGVVAHTDAPGSTVSCGSSLRKTTSLPLSMRFFTSRTNSRARLVS